VYGVAVDVAGGDVDAVCCVDGVGGVVACDVGVVGSVDVGADCVDVVVHLDCDDDVVCECDVVAGGGGCVRAVYWC